MDSKKPPGPLLPARSFRPSRFRLGETPLRKIDDRLVGIFRRELETGLSGTTVARLMRRFQTVFDVGVEIGVIDRNPFKGQRRGDDTDLSRQYHVSREEIDRVLSHCRTDRERLAIVLARFGGLRVPSELRELRFRDFRNDVIRIPKDTKTGYREVPLFDEIRETFERLEGRPDDLIFGRKTHDPGKFLRRAIEKSGGKVWPKKWINLRASRITELDAIGYTEKTLNAVFGNTAQVRRIHYLQSQKEYEYQTMLADNRIAKEFFQRRETGDTIPSNPILLREIVLAGRLSKIAGD